MLLRSALIVTHFPDSLNTTSYDSNVLIYFSCRGGLVSCFTFFVVLYFCESSKPSEDDLSADKLHFVNVAVKTVQGFSVSFDTAGAVEITHRL